MKFVAGEVEVSFLHPHHPATSFHYPSNPDILVMSCQDIMTTVNPTTVTGQSYCLTDMEILKSNNILAGRSARNTS